MKPFYGSPDIFQLSINNYQSQKAPLRNFSVSCHGRNFTTFSDQMAPRLGHTLMKRCQHIHSHIHGSKRGSCSLGSFWCFLYTRAIEEICKSNSGKTISLRLVVEGCYGISFGKLTMLGAIKYRGRVHINISVS